MDKKTMNFLNKITSRVSIQTKPLKYIPGEKCTRKGNVDIEITLDVVRFLDQIDTVILLSGDSDFLELKNYVVKDKKKQIIFMSYEENMAWELRQCQHVYLNRIRSCVELKK